MAELCLWQQPLCLEELVNPSSVEAIDDLASNVCNWDALGFAAGFGSELILSTRRFLDVFDGVVYAQLVEILLLCFAIGAPLCAIHYNRWCCIHM